MRLSDGNCSFCGNPEDVGIVFLEVLVCWGNLDLDTRYFYSYLRYESTGCLSFSETPHFCHISVWSVQQVTGKLLCISCGERGVPKHLKKGSKEKGTKIDKFSVLDYVPIQCSVHLIDLRKNPEKLDLQSRFLALCLVCIRPCLWACHCIFLPGYASRLAWSERSRLNWDTPQPRRKKQKTGRRLFFINVYFYSGLSWYKSDFWRKLWDKEVKPPTFSGEHFSHNQGQKEYR